jgi:pantoate--beta-alanine ligase
VRVVRTVPELREAILEHRVAGRSVGFVPTMGFLHEGQLSIIRRARADSGCVVVSSFVNPTVFPSPEDAARYPRDEPRDVALLEPEGVDILFVPEAATLHEGDDLTKVTVEGLTRRLEGASRPGYLDALTTATIKLVHLVGPARLYLGQKDAQRAVVTRRMLRDLFVNVELVVCPTVRDPDGVAIGAQNRFLSIEERHAASCLYAALSAAQAAYDRGERSAEVLRARMTDVIAAEPMARPDYISVADADSLDELQRISRPAVALLAVWIGKTRLADAMPLGSELPADDVA